MPARRILAIDGGGIKGVIPAAFLATLEDALGKRVLHHFDLIAGTSTGAIIALGLGLGLPADKILAFYEEEGPAIFGKRDRNGRGRARPLAGFRSAVGRMLHWIRTKHSAAPLESALRGAFGERRLGDCATRVVVPAFDRERRDVHVFKTAHHPRFRLDWKEPAVDVAMASAAALTYLPSHRLNSGISLIDGGVWANNPVGLAVVEALAVLEWKPECLRVLSLGCSESPFEIPERGGKAKVAPHTVDVFIRGQSQASLGTAKLLLGTKSDDRLFRYQPDAPEGRFRLDDTNQIERLRGIGCAMARHALPALSEVFFLQPADPFAPYHPEPRGRSAPPSPPAAPPRRRTSPAP